MMNLEIATLIKKQKEKILNNICIYIYYNYKFVS